LAFKSVWQTLNAEIVSRLELRFTYLCEIEFLYVSFITVLIVCAYSSKVNETISVDHVVDYGASSVCPSGTLSYGDTPFANSVDSTKVVANSGVTSWDSY